MGISLLHIKILKQLLEQIPIQPVSMISLGYPDALVTVEGIVRLNRLELGIKVS